MTPTEKHTTKCRECPQAFSASTMGIPIIGETAPAKVMKFVMALADHLATKHRPTMDKLSGSVQDFTGLLIVNNFETDDPGMLERADAIRFDIHKRTRKHFITDAAILDLVSRIGLDEPHAAAVITLIKGVRDVYEETGDWTPEKQRSRLIQPLHTV